MIIFAFGSAVKNSIFNNYLLDTFDLSAGARGWLEIPRELPGLLVTFTIGILFFVPEMRLLGITCLMAGSGMIGLALFSPDIPPMVIWVFVWSMGAHVQMVLIEKVALGMGIAKNQGHRLGRMNGLRSLGMILGASFVAILTEPLNLNYSTLFLFSAGAMTIGGLIYLSLSKDKSRIEPRRAPIVFKKRYTRYYLLAALFGIRKQIFITFAPWFLVKILGLEPEHIARILMISATLGVLIKPKLGKMIDRFGERRILMIDGLTISVLCLGYVIFPMLFKDTFLIVLCAGCFIMDELLFTLRTARTTWLVKIAETPADVTSTMSAAVSLDHILSMSISGIAGMAWIVFGYQSVFIFCVVIALLMTFVSAGIRVKCKC